MTAASFAGSQANAVAEASCLNQDRRDPERSNPARNRPTSQSPFPKNVHFMSSTSEWSTPQWLFDTLNVEFHFTLDPCATPGNAKCPNYFTLKEDGLSQDWGRNTVFMNPPYGRAISRWMRKAYESARQGATVVCLVPARTDTNWWHQFAIKGEVRFLKGRIRFGDARNTAPFPSAVVVFRGVET